MYWLNGWIVRIDDGETDESIADLYVTPTLPASKVEVQKDTSTTPTGTTNVALP